MGAAIARGLSTPLHLRAAFRVCIYAHVDSRTVIAKIEAAGWCEVRQEGSHKHFQHPTKPGTLTVAHPKKHIPIGTLRDIAKRSGVDLK
jgi:predicted RNA binding protein YcfA (HicA-like mRNA interferase family)